jgi:hypothetical protein
MRRKRRKALSGIKTPRTALKTVRTASCSSLQTPASRSKARSAQTAGARFGEAEDLTFSRRNPSLDLFSGGVPTMRGSRNRSSVYFLDTKIASRRVLTRARISLHSCPTRKYFCCYDFRTKILHHPFGFISPRTWKHDPKQALVRQFLAGIN